MQLCVVGIVAKSLKRLAICKATQQLPTLLGQQRSELLRPFARILKLTRKLIKQVRLYQIDL